MMSSFNSIKIYMFVLSMYIIISTIMLTLIVKAKSGKIVSKNQIKWTGVIGIVYSIVAMLIGLYIMNSTEYLYIFITSMVGSILYTMSIKNMRLAIIGVIIFALSIPLNILLLI